MGLEIAYPHVEKVAGQPNRLVNHPRIRIAQLAMDYLAHGWSAEEMCHQHDYLSLSEAHAALLYYWDHREEVDRETREELERYELERSQAPPSPMAMRLKVAEKVGR